MILPKLSLLFLLTQFEIKLEEIKKTAKQLKVASEKAGHPIEIIDKMQILTKKLNKQLEELSGK